MTERNDACRSFVQQITNDLDRVDKQREDANSKKTKKATTEDDAESSQKK